MRPIAARIVALPYLSNSSSCRLAARRMDELFDKYGKATILAAIGRIFDETETKCRKDCCLAVFVEQLVHAARRQPTGCHLRFHVAERGFRKPDVVLEHTVERLVELALL